MLMPEEFRTPMSGLTIFSRRLNVFRYLIITLTLLTLAISLSCFICFNVAIVNMTDSRNSSSNPTGIVNDMNVSLSDVRFTFSNSERAWIFASPFIGACLLSIPVAISMRRLGTRITHCVAGILTAVVTFCTPWIMVYLPFWLFFAFRLLHGAALANLYPVVSVVVAEWSPVAEKGFFVSTLTGYLQLSCMIAMPLAGLLVDFANWPVVFFVHGAMAFLIFVTWFFFYTASPASNGFVSDDEIILIQQGKSVANQTHAFPVPYFAIFTTRSVLAVFCAVFGNFMAFNFANTFMPTFFHSLYGFSSLVSALITAGILTAQFFVKIITGVVTDRLVNIPELVKVRWCNSIAFVGTALFLTVATAVPITWTALSVVSVAVPYAVLGTNGGGFPKSAMLISGQHAPTVMAAFQVVLCGSFLISSLVVPAIAPTPTDEELHRVFVLYVVLLILTNGVFCAFADTSPAPWARSRSSSQGSAKHAS